MALFLLEGHPAALHRADLGERLARIRQGRPGALVTLRAEASGPRLAAVVEAADDVDARAVWAMGSLACHGVWEMAGPVAAALAPGTDEEIATGGQHQDGGKMEAEVILARARAEGETLGCAGALTPEEAWRLLKLRPEVRLVDVRSDAERELVGRIPGALEVTFMAYPTWQENPDFLAEIGAVADKESLLLLICRSGQRSLQAARTLQAAGYGHCFNVREGFEGEKDAQGRRTLNGWRLRGLPWEQ